MYKRQDYTGLTIQDDSKVKVTFQEAKDTDGNDFSTDYANSYKAVYYVEPVSYTHLDVYKRQSLVLYSLC